MELTVFDLVFMMVMGLGIGLLLGAWFTIEVLRAGDRILNRDGSVLVVGREHPERAADDLEGAA